MHIKQKTVIAFLSLIVSVAIFVLILTTSFDLKKRKNINNTVINSINVLEVNSFETLHDTVIDIERAKNAAEEVVDLYRNKQYGDIYSLFNYEVQKRGSRDQFIQYMDLLNKRYGDMVLCDFSKSYLSNDKCEYELHYNATYKNVVGKIDMVLWVRFEEENLSISGIKFIENSW